MMVQQSRQLILALVSALLLSLVPVAQAQSPSADESRHIEAARNYEENDQTDYEIHEWRAALGINPKSLEASIGLAESLMRMGYIQDALYTLEFARKNIDRLSLELTYAKALEMAGNYSAAEKVYLTCMQRSPQDLLTFSRLVALEPKLPDIERQNLHSYLENMAKNASRRGEDAMKKGNYEEAARNFRISAAYLPNESDLNNFGLSLLLIGQYFDAQKQYELLKQKRENKWEYHANSALVALGRGHEMEAANSMHKAINLCQDSASKPPLYNVLGFIYEKQRKWADARNAYERAISLNPDYRKAYLNLAYAYLKDMAYEQAIRTYENLLKKEPNNVEVLNQLGLAYELAHKERRAVAIYRKAIQAHPKEKEAYFYLSNLYRKMGKNTSADATYKQLMLIQFDQIESGKTVEKPGSKLSEEARNPKTRLLEFVDIFASGPSPSQVSHNTD